MPSVPQSLLWISLVVLWLFVLVPMLISKRDAVRRTSDVALATRVLNSGPSARRLKRGGPAAGHRSDPDWQAPEDGDDELDDEEHDEEPPRIKSVVLAPIDDSADTEPNYIDVDVVEDSAALPVGRRDQPVGRRDVPVGRRDVPVGRRDVLVGRRDVEEEPEAEPPAEPVVSAVPDVEDDVEDAEDHIADAEDDVADAEDDVEEAEDDVEEASEAIAGEAAEGTDDEYEYVEDTSGLASSDDPPTTVPSTASRRRRYDPEAAAAASARKYKFRRRFVTALVLMLIASAIAGYFAWPTGWWACRIIGAFTLLYLVYLRRQTRIEQRLRLRRMQRMARSRLGVENTEDGALDLVPSRLRRPGAVVLEIDDEDPIFEHLDYTPGPMGYQLPKAAGQ
ncbi:gephyrin-like molybdotransferase receptor GlpR [Mycobacterium sp.]|uniref:divisome protein SepX/GlpR n=1 Tax=Mycobacterium sp. TaxID=1785 RepID=UPI002D4935C6|nr:gephyrin-like molybdotransferase receptor GlpR [Mycobacterium sp.]HZA09157.1 gephyrin-like molybdotransferase receptor GlpR [Mycobacterium sp.]